MTVASDQLLMALFLVVSTIFTYFLLLLLSNQDTVKDMGIDPSLHYTTHSIPAI